MNNLQLRIVSALVLAALALGLTWLGGLWFRLLCAGISAVIFYEWTRMSRPVPGAGLCFLPEALLLVLIGALIAGAPASWLLLLAAAAVVITAATAQLRGGGQWVASGLAYAAL